MKKPSETYNPFDIVVIPFPFTDNLAHSKLRPAVVLSHHGNYSRHTGHVICAMITSARKSAWPMDVKITDLKSAGLEVECVIRMKIFSLDERFIVRKAGALEKKDRKSLKDALKASIPLL